MIQIEKLVMKGFKSFQRKTSIPFFPGMTAIVGKNGSGKSNILDAIMFVLGHRSSHLRANKLENLIFNGGKGKKPSDYAHVTLYINNEGGEFDKLLDEPNDEITIGRKVTRASSTYKFMGKNCKRKKIDKVLDIAGIDLDGHHFIKQGEVTGIIDMSSNQRRKIIDDLAGITSYEEKKEKAMGELEEAKNKLKEHEILLEERKSYLDKLKDERDTALKYKELKERKEKLKASITHVKKKELEEELKEKEKEKEETEVKIEELEDKVNEYDKKIEKLSDEKEEVEDEIEEEKDVSLVKDIEKLKNRVVRKKGEIDNKRSEIENIEDTLEEVDRLKKRQRSGMRKSVRAVLDRGKSGVYGTVSELMDVPDKYSVAIDTAAGSHMNDIVVDARQTAIDCINYLKNNNMGRARMLPMDKLTDYNKSSRARKAVKSPGVVDFAINLVDFESKYRRAFNYVFRDTLIVEDLESVKNKTKIRAVTLDGDILSKGGAMTGGSNNKSSKKRKSSKNKGFNKKEKKEKIKKLKEEIKTLKHEIGELNQLLEEKKEQQKKRSQVSEELKEKEEELEDELSKIREARQRDYSKKLNLEKKIDKIDSKQESIGSELESIKEDKEEVEIDNYIEEDLEQLKKEKKQTLSEMNSIGPVNMRSIEEYNQFKEEYDQFKEKIDELKSEKEEIEQIIEDIEQEKERRFSDSLEKVRDKFKKLFKELFDGGDADLELEDKEDINSGLLIKANPPDKEAKVIDTLSGGEKTLTAISFVLAVQEYKPSPLYIMDEIDAVLDKSYSKRLASLLKDYSNQAQLVVVTHNEETARYSDRVYGTSMVEGVSKIRAIEL